MTANELLVLMVEAEEKAPHASFMPTSTGQPDQIPMLVHSGLPGGSLPLATIQQALDALRHQGFVVPVQRTMALMVSAAGRTRYQQLKQR